MKLNLFLSVVVFLAFRLCKAGPLRQPERKATFYIANETACIVDDIVYTSGDPVPTNDPCEACRCRPPGFACVLKECKIKPGCRAVRHAGECCPEYLCGCEHNGKFYQYGDEIKDPKNPCVQCYCQPTAVACAYVECIYRDNCDSVFVPGECCPQYINCTTDIPDRNLFLGGNVFPSVNLLPVLTDEPVLPDISSEDQVVELIESPSSTIQPQEPTDSAEKESSGSTELGDYESSSTFETVEPTSFVTEATNLNTEVGEKDTVSLESSEKEKQEEKPKKNENNDTTELTKEKNALLNSESDINKDDVTENSDTQNLKITTEELPHTTVGSKPEETADEAVVTEKTSDIESTSTQAVEKDPLIKNSASENGKSLKLKVDQLEEKQKEQENVKSDGEVFTELASESTNTVPANDLKESSTEESKTQSEDNVAEESQTNGQATPLSINNAKIKSESAEIVTIVVHVKESAKIPTETDFIAETVTPVSVTNIPEENLLKSQNNIVSTNSEKKSTEIEDNKSTNTNFEVFPVTKQISETELTSKSPSTDQNSENIKGGPDEADNIALEAEENPIREEKVPVLKSENDSSVKTTTMNSTEIDKELRTGEEVTEETKIDEPTSTVIRADTTRPIITEITDSASSPKPEKSTTELENKRSEVTEEKESKIEKKVESAVPESREDAVKIKEDLEETTTVQSEEQSTKEKNSSQLEKLESTTEKVVLITEEKAQESTPTNIDEKPETRTNDEVETDKEKTIIDKAKEKTTQENKSEATTESQNQTTEEPKQTTLNDNQ